MDKLLYYNLQFFADGPGGEKTEPATQKKLNDARDEGKVSKSKELTSAIELILLFVSLKIFVSYVSNGFINVFNYIYTMIPEFVNQEAMGAETMHFMTFFRVMILNSMGILAPFFIVSVFATFVVTIMQVGWKVTTKPLAPKLDKFNPINGFKRIVSKDSFFELAKSIIKIGLIAYIAYSSVKNQAGSLFLLYDMPLSQAVVFCGTIVINTGLKISAFYLIVGLADFLYQKYKFSEDMKMTKQEVKDEMKNTEGNPEIKQRQRQRMREASQRRMMSDVPTADVIITNPTHYAVALKYDAEVAKAPLVVAKGEDYLAQKIKEVAKENNVEIVENKPLARMLYANVDIGQEIPPELYQAVADILANIYRAKNIA